MSEESTEPLSHEKLAIDENELYEVYSLLEDATTAASTGDTNSVAELAAKAKRKVLRIHDGAEVVEVEGPEP